MPYPSSIENEGKGANVPEVIKIDLTFKNANSLIANDGAKHQ